MLCLFNLRKKKKYQLLGIIELKYLLKIAIEDEEYEIACDLRDEIKKRVNNK